ncbi:alpha-beta hydrolase superfamily lysophospholipase [Gracilibacillus halotolerans]|uniref:Alpha-beta hydrolase superfamily lysophospholipase n=1 Tax=Gracilibacillus halotolerans TaxID=74386 RepID=A0A841RQX0_9BACI|nr:alpha/beta hydrolase [Gracilibacillus halotolerans]MBB6513756.1 alpha-beta hydrolase superfamily lysophospholipase [Gracilibacillus halotolerans]
MSDGVSVFIKIWEPTSTIKAIVQLSHGMAEHINRYDDFASYLVERGILVIGNDHRGHGQTGAKNLGFIAESDGSNRMVEDIIAITTYIQKSYPTLPIFLIGHSMGSFIVRSYLTKESKRLSGAILIGTGTMPSTVLKPGIQLAKFISRIRGKRQKGTFLNKVSFFGYNKRTRKKSDFDWLSVNEDNVQAYLEDPYCGFIPSNQFFVDLYQLYLSAQDKVKADNISKSFPILLLAGEEDPVGNYGKGINKAASFYQSKGLTNVQTKLYPNMSHEVLNEKMNVSVYDDIYHWLKGETLE